jgi:hypothetical protein
METPNTTEMTDLGTLPNGAHLYRKSNTAGGHIYYSDECGVEAVVWDTCICTEATLLAAIVCEHHRRYMEHMIHQSWRPRNKAEAMQIFEQTAATGGSFIPDDIRKLLESDDENV